MHREDPKLRIGQKVRIKTSENPKRMEFSFTSGLGWVFKVLNAGRSAGDFGASLPGIAHFEEVFWPTRRFS